jgi:hypothetical protein
MPREGSFALASFGTVRKVQATAFVVVIGRKSVALKRILEPVAEPAGARGVRGLPACDAPFAFGFAMLLALIRSFSFGIPTAPSGKLCRCTSHSRKREFDGFEAIFFHVVVTRNTAFYVLTPMAIGGRTSAGDPYRGSREFFVLDAAGRASTIR